MNRILKSARLDFFAAGSTVTTMALYFFLNTILSFYIKNPLITISNGAMFAMTLSAIIFLNQNNKLYGILPVKRWEVVAGRYIYGVSVGAVNLMLSYILAFIVSIVFNIYSTFEIMNTCLPPMLALMFIYYCLMTGIYYPMCFAFGYKNIMSIPIILTYILINMFVTPFLYTANPDSPGWLNRHGQFITKYPLFTIAAGIIIGLIIIVISAVISNMIYKKKEI